MNAHAPQPPAFITAILQRCLPSEHRDSVLGDLAEEYARIGAARSRSATNRWYYKEAFMAVMHVFFSKLPRVCSAIALNLATLAMLWLMAFVANYLLGDAVASGAILSTITAIGVAISLRVRARAAAFFLAAMLAFVVAEWIAHTAWGYRVVQGAQTHFTVMGAGILGVTFGALLVRYLTSRASKPGVAHIPA